LVEYTLLIAFVTLASAALFIDGGGGISGIWNTTHTRLSKAEQTAS
jgi:Flp pilus assembly pilin Flp